MTFHCTCADKPPHVVSHEPAKIWDISEFSEPQRRLHEQAFREYQIETAAHEAGHVIGGALIGKRSLYAQLGAQPHVNFKWSDSTPTIAALVVPTLGGPIAGCYALRCIVPPRKEAMLDHISAARAGHVARCDNCQIADVFAYVYSDETDDALAERWLDHWRRVADAFDRVDIRGQVRMLARELRERVYLTDVEIERVIDYPYLESLRHLVDPDAERNDLPANISSEGFLQ